MMQKDFKTGLAVGATLMAVVAIWLATRPGLNPQAGTPPVGRRAVEPSLSAPHRALSGNGSVDPQTVAHSPRPTANATTSTSDIDPRVGDLTIYEQSEKIKTQRFHIVRRRETLSQISAQYYGSANMWSKIVKANPFIKDPNRVMPGTKLTIPD